MEAPFTEIMRQAAALKTHHDSFLRKRYDSWPPWYQNSMFSTAEVESARKKDFSQRFKFAIECKESGNSYFKQSSYYDAISQYERAVSIFKWVQPLDEKWREKVNILVANSM